MDITCISDLHGHYPDLEVGDLLIVAGDLTSRDTEGGYLQFFEWLSELDYKKKIVIAGNHDCKIQEGIVTIMSKGPISYLCDSGTEFDGLKVWGSPWTKTFPGMNPACKAFTCETEEELAKKWELIPLDTDILITHSPAFSYLDKSVDGRYCGSASLRDWTRKSVTKRGAAIALHVHGHIHEAYGECGDEMITRRVNASHVNERYQPVNKPIRVVL